MYSVTKLRGMLSANRSASLMRRCNLSSAAIRPGFKVSLSEEVKTAIYEKQPVVALESTIITHGMPYPDNIRLPTQVGAHSTIIVWLLVSPTTALRVEEIVRRHGAIPATIALLNGKVRVGLSAEQLNTLGDTSYTGVVKVSRRDLGYAIANKLTGGTTVSATMMAAHAANIKVFVTGGVGGVHRDVDRSMDVSADLRELGRTPMAVVCAGIKSILDIGRTLEYLETEGVCVAAYNEDGQFPAFFTRDSGFKAPSYVKDINAAASLIDANLILNNSVLLAVPIPEESCMDSTVVQAAIQTALLETIELKITGKDVTPYLLKRVNELTGGASLKANVALIENNARVGALIACKLADTVPSLATTAEGVEAATPYSFNSRRQRSSRGYGNVVVVGGINTDITARFTDEIIPNGATNPGKLGISFGGVGRNLATALTYLDKGSRPLPHLISSVGDDSYGKMFFGQHKFMDLSGIHVNSNESSAVYCGLVNNKSELLYGIGDFDIHASIDVQFVKKSIDNISNARMVVLDGNIPKETIEYICNVCSEKNIPVWYEPTDILKAAKPLQTDSLRQIAYSSPNLQELKVMHRLLFPDNDISKEMKTEFGSILYQTESMSKDIVSKYPKLTLVVTLGPNGLMITRNGHLPVHNSATFRTVAAVSGAGDCLAAGMIDRLLDGATLMESVELGMRCADISMDYDCAVPVQIQEYIKTFRIVSPSVNNLFNSP